MSRDPVIEEISRQSSSSGSISIDTVRTWMQNDDIEVMGALWDKIVSEDSVVRRIEPTLVLEEAERFIMRYFERVVLENPDGEWSDSRYSILTTIASFFQDASADRDDPFLADLKVFLARMYIEGNSEIRNAIVTGALEHIMEQRRWREFYKDWCDDPILGQAYNEALEWIK